MQVTKGTRRMHEQCALGSFSSFPAEEPGNEAVLLIIYLCPLRLSRALSTLGQYLLKGGICSRVEFIQCSNYSRRVLLKGRIYSRVVVAVQSTQ